ncbi:hypothetical protein KDU71_09845 [Carboxylicivirga sediminis]|uniref:Glycosyl hydrolase family 95 N-terminal domain-containing protein n=1 Tax=Carboxylicivirga sediminis TaxID=2006564 RepID=A0A941IYJ2_9BACT|nr:hypothetical protein [Carboxylicivirga sediminis]MBR8535857.1 hypothetical protein [Carboxylicivirga sediminis]
MRITLFIIALFTIASCNKGDVKNDNILFSQVLENARINQTEHSNSIQNAVFIGNGDINGMLFSSGNDLVINLSKNDIWDARLDTENDPPLMKIDIASRKYSGGAKEHDTPPSWKNPYPCPRMCGKLIIKNKAPFSSTLDIREAKANINSNEIEVRALAQKNAFLIQSEEEVGLEAVYVDYLPKATLGEDENVCWLTQDLPADKDWKGMSFAVALARGEQKTAVGIVSSFDSPNPKADAIAMAKQVLAEDATELVSEHDKIWAEFWSRSAIQLEDTILTNIWYQNLYFMRCVSKPGVYPIGLYAGAANENALWHGSYTLDYNVEQAFWGPYCCNQGELSEPYDRLILDYLPRAKWFAWETFELDGAFYPINIFGHEPSPDACVSVNKRMMAYIPWSYVLGTSGYVSRNIWLRYKYYPDENYLKNIAYPLLKESSIFYCNVLEQCNKDEVGKAILGPSFSPEHGDFGTYNCAFDIAFITSTFNSTLEAIDLQNTDSALAERIKTNMKLIPELPLSEGKNPVVVDWPGDDPKRSHNIPTTVASVFPAETHSWFSPTLEKEILTSTVNNIKNTGVNSMITMAVAKARLSIDGTWKWLKEELVSRRRSNGMLTIMPGDHPFNSFGIYTEDFSCSGAITELLLQSVDDIIRVFPAWPLEKEGKFKNLRAQGGFLVSSEQKDSQIRSIYVTSTVGGTCRVLNPWNTKDITILSKGEKVSAEVNTNQIISFETQKGESYIIKSIYNEK